MSRKEEIIVPRQYNVRHVVPLSGKDSLCTAIVQMERAPNLPYEFIFCDVRMELPETYQWLNEVEKKLGVKIKRVGKSLEQTIMEVGKLPNHLSRFCTLETKIKPMEAYFTNEDTDKVINYVGYRADEKDRIPPSGIERIAKARREIDLVEVYPLIEEGINLTGVYKILGDRDLSPPSFFWKRLYDEVYERSGPASQTFMEDVLANKPWTMSYLFSWRSRSNCFMCFYQRLYEWVGLLEHHPDLYVRAEEIERVYGGAKSEYRLEKTEEAIRNTDDFCFHQGWPLKELRKEADRIFDRRVNAVYDLIVERRRQPLGMVDLLSTTSCGAYCGK